MKVVCGPTHRWLDGAVEFWCERHAYAKTIYPDEQHAAEERAHHYGWKLFNNGKWHCPWCRGRACRYLDKFRKDTNFSEYLKDASERVFLVGGTWLETHVRTTTAKNGVSTSRKCPQPGKVGQKFSRGVGSSTMTPARNARKRKAGIQAGL